MLSHMQMVFFEAYPQLLTEMALRIPYQMKKISESGNEPMPHFDHAWFYQLCELMITSQAPVVKRQEQESERWKLLLQKEDLTLVIQRVVQLIFLWYSHPAHLTVKGICWGCWKQNIKSAESCMNDETVLPIC